MLGEGRNFCVAVADRCAHNLRVMIRFRLFCLSVLVVGAAQAPGGQAPTSIRENTAALALVGGRVISSPDAAPIEDATVVLGDGVIQEVGPKARVKVPSGAR